VSLLTGIVGRFKTGTYTVTRRGAGTHGTDGDYTPGSETSFLVDAAVFPFAGGRKIDFAALGQRAGDTREVFTEVQLVADPDRADVITIDGESYGVFHSAEWQDLDERVFWRALASRRSP
jgi:hypothetical protein